MKKTFTIALVAVLGTALLGLPVQAKTVTGKVSPAAAKAITTVFPQTDSRSMDASKSSVVVSRKTGSVKVKVTGNKKTFTRPIQTSTKVDSQTKVNSREGTITVDLTTGEVSYTYTSDTGMTLVWPVLWGICGPSVGAGLRLKGTATVNPLKLEFKQGPFMEGGVGCGWGCANVSFTLNVSGGAQERIPLNCRYAVAELYGDLSADITANACGVIKFKLASWTLKNQTRELARASF